MPTCPVCGSTRRLPAPDTAGDNRYVRAISLVAPISAEEVRDLLQCHRCLVCSALYCDPWLSRRVAASLYSAGIGQHNGGWQILHASVAGREVETHAYWQRQTWKRIQELTGCVSRYAELNCPFSGLFTHFRRRELVLSDYRRLARRSVRSAKARRRQPEGVLAVVRRLLEPRTGVIEEAPPDGRGSGLPRERFLVIEPSSGCWGASCISRGVSCQSLAPTLLAASVLTADDVRREALRFDVSVLTQLDHFFVPMPVLEWFLEISRVVVVAGHRSHRLTKQHLFAFGPETSAHFRGRGWHAVDLTSDTVHPSKREVNQCVFVSSRVRL